MEISITEFNNKIKELKEEFIQRATRYEKDLNARIIMFGDESVFPLDEPRFRNIQMLVKELIFFKMYARYHVQINIKEKEEFVDRLSNEGEQYVSNEEVDLLEDLSFNIFLIDFRKQNFQKLTNTELGFNKDDCIDEWMNLMRLQKDIAFHELLIGHELSKEQT